MGDGNESRALPPLYAGWIEALLGGPLPVEARTTCHECVMLAPAGLEPVEGRVFFNPATKCCTYLPSLPNFTVGRVVADLDPSLAHGRTTVLDRLRAGVAVTPLGIARTPRYALLYRASPGAFGQAVSMRCPHFTGPEIGACGIRRHRPAVCATFFCRYARGIAGWQFWVAVNQLLTAVETVLARWCALELGIGAEAIEMAVATWPAIPAASGFLSADDLEDRVGAATYEALWGSWRSREAEFYSACGDRVASLAWNDVAAICGLDVRRLAESVRDAYRKLGSGRVPGRLRVGAWQTVAVTSQGTTIVTYNRFDPLSVSFTLLRLLHRFDGRPTDVVLRELDQQEHVRLSPGLLRRLIDHGLLVEAKSG